MGRVRDLDLLGGELRWVVERGLMVGSRSDHCPPALVAAPDAPRAIPVPPAGPTAPPEPTAPLVAPRGQSHPAVDRRTADPTRGAAGGAPRRGAELALDR